MNEQDQQGFELIKNDLKRIENEFLEMKRMLLKKPIDDYNFKAALLIRALEAYMFDHENGMLMVAQSWANKIMEGEKSRSVH